MHTYLSELYPKPLQESMLSNSIHCNYDGIHIMTTEATGFVAGSWSLVSNLPTSKGEPKLVTSQVTHFCLLLFISLNGIDTLSIYTKHTYVQDDNFVTYSKVQ